MSRVRNFLALLLFLVAGPANAQLISLAYHDVVDDPDKDPYALTRTELRAHLEFFRKNGYQPVSLNYLGKVQTGKARLPDRAVLLTFDDGLKSYNDIVVPLLSEYGYPSVLSVVSGWLDGKRVPPEYKGKLMTWSQVKQLSRLPLVEVVSHSHDLHHGVTSNPQGNESYAGTTRQYIPASTRYETEKAFASRIRADLRMAISRFSSEMGQRPLALTWPYGAYDSVTTSIAASLGFRFLLTLDPGAVATGELPRINRFLVTDKTDVKTIRQWLGLIKVKTKPVRFVDFGLDSMADASAEERELILSRLLDRIEALHVNAVIVSALTADQRQAFFPNPDIPVAADVLNRVLHQIRTRLPVQDIYVRVPSKLAVRNETRFYESLARFNDFTGIVFEGNTPPPRLDSIQRSIQRYRVDAEFGQLLSANAPLETDNLDLIVVKKSPATPMATVKRQVRKIESGNLRALVALMPDEDTDADTVARSMYELRLQGIENYGYRGSIANDGRMYPQILSELSVDLPPKRAIAAEILFFFVFFYPLFMAIFWMMGAVTFFMRREWGRRDPPELEVHPLVSVLVPCHNEELCIQDTVEHLSQNNYPNFEIIAINDGSTDGTAALLEQLADNVERLRVITLTKNHGKAKALRAGAMASRGEFLMCIDADALLDKNALFYMMKHFLSGPRVGAVTGNPRVMNRSGLLARIQIGEFSAIVGMIKRAQRSVGRLFTVSGVNACYRRSAVHKVGYWSSDTVTEDVDISWKLQLAHWDIRYEPKALTWILVPESLKGLWNQRLRWARGGFEAATRYAGNMNHWVSRRMWPVMTEYWLGVIWCYALVLTLVFWAATQLLSDDLWPQSLAVNSLLPGWTGVILAVVCLVQFAIGLTLDSYYERRGLVRYLFWAIWYPAVYWVFNAATTVAAVPLGIRQLLRKVQASGTWRSPGRESAPLPTLRRERQMGNERRQYFQKRSGLGSPRGATELAMTMVFWGLWLYFIMPLVSLILWAGGVYFFTDRMITMGGYQSFSDQLVNYTIAILAMALALTLWVIWNQRRYGRHDKRNMIPKHVSETQVGEATGLGQKDMDGLRSARAIFMHYDGIHPVVEKKFF